MNISLSASFEVRNGAIFVTDNGQTRTVKADEAREAIEQQLEHETMGARKGERLLAQIDALHSGAGVAAVPDSIERTSRPAAETSLPPLSADDPLMASLARLRGTSDRLAEGQAELIQSAMHRDPELDRQRAEADAVSDSFFSRMRSVLEGGEWENKLPPQIAAKLAQAMGEPAVAQRAPSAKTNDIISQSARPSGPASTPKEASVAPKSLADLKGQPKATAWLQGVQSQAVWAKAAQDAGGKIEHRFDCALLADKAVERGVGRGLAVDIFATILADNGLIPERTITSVDLSESGDAISKAIEARGVLLLENCDKLPAESPAFDIIEAVLQRGWPVLVLSGTDEFGKVIATNQKLSDAVGAPVNFGGLNADVLVGIFKAEAGKQGLIVPEDAAKAAFGRLSSMGADNSPQVAALLKEAKSRMASRLMPGGQASQELTREQLLTVTPDDLRRVLPLDEHGVLPSLTRFNGRIGQPKVKAQIGELFTAIKNDNEAELRGETVPPRMYNAWFEGEPGTGKTSGAWIVAEMLQESGKRPGAIIYRAVADILSVHPGQSAKNIIAAFDEAKNGTLILDELQQLLDHPNGLEVMQALIPLMWNRRFQTSTLCCGYQLAGLVKYDEGWFGRTPEEMRFMFDRFKRDELGDMLKQIAGAKGFTIGADAFQAALRTFDRLANGRGFQNARAAELLFDAARTKAAARTTDPVKRKVLLAEDFGGKDLSARLLLASLDKYVGFESVKEDLEQTIVHVQDLQEAGEPVARAFEPYRIISGTRGSGRASLAGELTRIDTELGFTGEGKTKLINAPNLRGAVLGASGTSTLEAIKNAVGGHLVIRDIGPLLEAYDTFSQEILAALRTELTSDAMRNRIAVSLIATPEEIQMLQQREPELAAVFTKTFALQTLDAGGAVRVLHGKLEEAGKHLSPEAMEVAKTWMPQLASIPGWQGGVDVNLVVSRMLSEQIVALRSAPSSKKSDRAEIGADVAREAFVKCIQLKGSLTGANVDRDKLLALVEGGGEGGSESSAPIPLTRSRLKKSAGKDQEGAAS